MINERYNMNKEVYDLEQLVHKRTYRTGEVTQLRRIADSLDEILRLIKEDQGPSRTQKKKEENES
jgi:hypothetical protein